MPCHGALANNPVRSGYQGQKQKQTEVRRLVAADGEHTRLSVWFATPRREHWGKPFDAGARRIVREARALPFELKPKPTLCLGDLSSEALAKLEAVRSWKRGGGYAKCANIKNRFRFRNFERKLF
jgi:hypothetical protein